MSFIAGNEITITWVIEPTATPLLASDYDIRYVPSGLDGTYTNDDIINYKAPTAAYPGNLQHKFTPAQPGHYQIFLTCGVAAAYLVLDKKDFWVFSPS